VENEKETVRLDRSGGQIIVAVLGVVEVKAAQLTDTEEARDNELDVRVRQMVLQINETLRPLAE
jgi:hypothetical protein